jgi:hypothetical protein
VTTSAVASQQNATITASYAGNQFQPVLVLTPPSAPVLQSLTLNPAQTVGVTTSTGTVTLDGNAPVGGALVTLSSNNTSAATVPASVLIAAGDKFQYFHDHYVGYRHRGTDSGPYFRNVRTDPGCHPRSRPATGDHNH